MGVFSQLLLTAWIVQIKREELVELMPAMIKFEA